MLSKYKGLFVTSCESHKNKIIVRLYQATLHDHLPHSLIAACFHITSGKAWKSLSNVGDTRRTSLDIIGTAAGRQTTECLTKLRPKNSDRKTFCILGRNFVTCKQVYRLLHGTHKEQCNLQKFEEQAVVSPWRLVTIVYRDQKESCWDGTDMF